MKSPGAALARRGVACILVVAGLAGCSSGATSSSSSSITAVGQTLDIYISEPPGFASDQAQENIVLAEQRAFAQEFREVTDFALKLIVVREGELSNNARAAIQDKSAIAYLGELPPGASEQTVGITNALDLPTLSPTDNALELTQSSGAISNTPNKYYESLSVYGRTFARMVPSSAQEATFDAKAIKSLGSSVYVADDGSDYGRAFAAALNTAASGVGLSVSSSQSSAGTIFYASSSPAAAAKFFKTAAASNSTAKLFAPAAMYAPSFNAALSAAARSRMYISVPGFTKGELNGAARTFVSWFTRRYGRQPDVETIFGYAAMSAVLRAIAHEGAAANSRAKVVKALLATTNVPVLGTFSLDKNGDSSLRSFVVVRAGGSMFTIPSASAVSPTG